jgi:hypothetical protein
MSYRFNTPAPPPRPISMRAAMTAMLVAFVVVSLFVFLAGRVPFTPTPTPLDRGQTTYRNYVAADRELLGGYARTPDGRVQIPIDRAMDLLVERGLPTRDNPSATP